MRELISLTCTVVLAACSAASGSGRARPRCGRLGDRKRNRERSDGRRHPQGDGDGGGCQQGHPNDGLD